MEEEKVGKGTGLFILLKPPIVKAILNVTKIGLNVLLPSRTVKAMRGNETLNQILEILREIGGYFVFQDKQGEEYLIVRKQDIGQLNSASLEPELQLPLPPAPGALVNSADDLLERINRDIALYQEAQEQFDDLGIAEIGTEVPASASPTTLPPPRRVRFEPLRGDLPPELQE